MLMHRLLIFVGSIGTPARARAIHRDALGPVLDVHSQGESGLTQEDHQLISGALDYKVIAALQGIVMGPSLALLQPATLKATFCPYHCSK